MEIEIEYNPETETYRTVHDFSASQSLSTTVILAVDQVVDDIGVVLNDAIDPDALDAIFRPRSDVAPYRRGRVEFTYSDCRILVRSDGFIEIDPDGGDDFDW